MQPDPGVEPTAPKPTARAELSEREQEILKLVATGASNKQIAQQLVISPNTVKVHLRNIFGKIGVATRTEAALFALRTGLLGTGATLPVDGEEGGAKPLTSAQLPSATALEPAAPGMAHPAPVALTPQAAPKQWWFAWHWILVVGVIVILLSTGGLWYWRTTMAPPMPTNAPTMATPRWQSLAPMPTARSGLAAAVYENKIYAIGGQTQSAVTGAMEVFDPLGNSWKTLAPKPLPVADVAAAVVGGRIYVPGGRMGDGTLTSTVQYYDPRQNVWSNSAPLPQPLDGYALVAYEGRLYMFGGWDGSQYVGSTYRYDPSRDQWTALTSMPIARGFAGSAVAGGNIYVFGGLDGKSALSVNEQYIPEADTAGQKPWVERKPLPEGRYGMGSASAGEMIQVAGGRGSAVQLAQLEYLPLNDQWQVLPTQVQGDWSAFQLVAAGSSVYAIGGTVAGSATSQNLAYQAIYTISLPAFVR